MAGREGTGQPGVFLHGARDRCEREAEVGCLLTVHVAGCLVLLTRNAVRDVNGRYFRIQRYVTLRLIPHST